MTSATGRKRSDGTGRAGPRHSARPVRGRSVRAGFTLMELVLATSLVLLLATVVIVAFGLHGRVRDLEEGSLRFEAALRLARAEAAGAGRRFCLVIASGGEGEEPFQVLWEPEPLAEPGRFVRYWGGTWPRRLPADLVEVTRIDLMGSAAYRTLGLTERPLDLVGVGPDADLLMFEPDGTGDSCLIELAALDLRDERRAIVELDGATGKVTRCILTPSELEAFYAEREAEVF